MSILSRIALQAALATAALAQAAASAAQASDPHAAHRVAAPAATGISLAEYALPDITLRDQDGRRVRLRELLVDGQPVVVDFIYTSCSTLCPVMTATLLQLQRELRDDPVRPRYVSLSIDPDYDTSRVLSEYAARMQADWTFVTGARDDMQSALTAFGAWRGNKVNHFALTLMRRAGETRWTRIEGLRPAGELAALWRAGPT